MKKFKKALALSLTLAMGMSMVACGDKKESTTSAGTQANTDAPSTTEAPKTEAPKTEEPKTDAPNTEEPKTDAPATTGIAAPDTSSWTEKDKIYAYSWDDDFKKKLDVILDAYPQYKDYVEYINLGVASEESLELIDQALKSGDKYPSLIPADIGSAKYYTENDDKTLDLYSIGFTPDMFKDTYQYAVDFATYNGQLKAVTWQSAAGSVFYNRAIAKEVFGTDDPDAIQEKLKDWDSFFAAAEELKAKGYKIVETTKDIYYAIINAHTEPWVQEADGKEVFVPDATITEYLEKAKKLADGEYVNSVKTGDMWRGGWSGNMKDGGNVFCYFCCPWMIGVMQENGATDGSWGACVGPNPYYWGGTYVSVGKNTNNPELAAFICYELACDADMGVKITNVTGDAVSNKAANDRLVAGEISADNNGVKFLGGQNPYGTWAAAAPGIKQAAVTYQDKNYEALIAEAADGYITGTYASVDEALNYVKKQSKIRFGIEAK